MGEFGAAWLELREPFDHAARSRTLARQLIDSVSSGPLRLLDLACGTGSNYRYLRTLSPPREGDWLLVDRDLDLLALVPRTAGVAVRQQDLSALGDDLFLDRDVVTASALLDLVSESWMLHLAGCCARARSAALFALTYDGRISCEPPERDDGRIRELVNRDQQRDKGFGPALGPDAIACVARAFGAAGYTVRSEPSDWMLSSVSRASQELQRQLIEGWASAAAAVSPVERIAIERWRRRRLAHVDDGRSRIVVGHQDQLAVLR